MPKHKLNLNAASEPVPIDNTGPEVDVDVDEDPSLPIEPQQPDKPILGNDGAEEAVPEVETEEEVVAQTENDEHQEYSKNVKKRIDKLMEVALGGAEDSEDDEIKIKAATAGTGLANQISKNAELIYKIAHQKMIEQTGDQRKVQSFGPDHVVVPVQNNVSVTVPDSPE